MFSDAAFALANLSVAAALFLLFSVLHGASRWFALMASVASALLATGNTLEHCVAEPFSLMYILAAMILAVTLVGTSVTLLLSRQLRWWQAALPALSVVLGLMLSYEHGGAALTGLSWLAFRASMITVAPIRVPSPARDS